MTNPTNHVKIITSVQAVTREKQVTENWSIYVGDRSRNGAALGAGIEYGFTPNMSAKLQYLYVTGASLEISRTALGLR